MHARRRSVSLFVSVAIALLVTERAGLSRASSSSRAHGIGDTRLEFDELELVVGSLPLELAPDVVLVADKAGGELVFEALVVITVSGDGAETGMAVVVVAVGGGGGGGGAWTILPGII